MRYILTLLCLIGIAYGQSTVYLRADSIKIMKQNGNANLQILNATRDTTNGVLMNIGNGVTAFIRIVQISSTQFTVGTDTITMEGGGGGSDSTALLRNPTIAGYAILDFSSYVDTVYGKRFLPGYGLLFDSTATTITPRVDTATLGVLGRGYGWQILGNTLAADGRFGTNSNHDIHVYTNNIKRAEITNGGQFLWNATSSPFSQPFYVNDTAQIKAIRINSSASAISSPALLAIKSSTDLTTDYSLQIQNNSSLNTFRLSNAGDITGVFGSLQSSLWAMNGTTGIFRASNGATTTGNLLRLSHFNASTHTSGNVVLVQTYGNFSATTGTGTYTSLEVAPILNQTGGTGKTWGMRIRPLFTDASDWIPMEITSDSASWPVYNIQQDLVRTTSATVTTLHTFTTESQSTYIFVCYIVGNRTGGASGATGDIGTYIYEGSYKNVSGVVTLIAETLRVVNESQAGWNVTTAISGTNILLQVTGATNNDIVWGLTKGEVNKLAH